MDLESQKITIDGDGSSESFEINDYKKLCLMHGWDDIDYIRTLEQDILKYENQRVTFANGR